MTAAAKVLAAYDAAGLDEGLRCLGYTTDVRIQLSIATSLKRIADNLDAITQHSFGMPAIRVSSIT